MKLYLLLRSNVESGPYTQKELKEIGLAPTDLIWIEGESMSWQHPTEINGLKNIAKAGIIKPLNNVSTSLPCSQPTDQFASTDKETFTSSEYTAQNYVVSQSENIYPLEDKESFSWEARRPRISATAVANSLFGLGVLMIGVMLFAFVVKKLVDHFEYEPHIASAQAVEISSESLPVNSSSHAARGALPSKQSQVETQPPVEVPVTIENAVAVTPQPDKTQKLQQSATTEEKKVETPVAEPETVAQTEVKEEKKPEEKEVKPVAKPAPSLSVSANDYKVGMFGGISDLEITVNNPSSLNIDRAVVEVEFLKPNGSVAKSQTVSVENIAPGGTKKISVPSSNRGVKVRYRIVSTDVQDGKVASNDI